MFAAQHGFVALTKLFIARGADVDAIPTKDHSTALMKAARLNHFEVVKILLEAGARFGPMKEGLDSALDLVKGNYAYSETQDLLEEYTKRYPEGVAPKQPK